MADMNDATSFAHADTEPPPPPVRWRVLTSRGARGRSWEELTDVERSQIRTDFGDSPVSLLMYWERAS